MISFWRRDAPVHAAEFVDLVSRVIMAVLNHVEHRLVCVNDANEPHVGLQIAQYRTLALNEDSLAFLRHSLEFVALQPAHRRLMRHFAAAYRDVDQHLAEVCWRPLALLMVRAAFRIIAIGNARTLGRSASFLAVAQRLSATVRRPETKNLTNAPFRYAMAIGLLRLLPRCSTPSDKLRCLVNAQAAVRAEVSEYWRVRSSENDEDALDERSVQIGGDDLLPILSYVVLKGAVVVTRRALLLLC